jgi:hypothetical protein
VPRYRLTLTFTAPQLTVRMLAWFVRLYGDKDAPRELRARFERIDDS